MRMPNWIFATLCCAGLSLNAQPTSVLLPTTTDLTNTTVVSAIPPEPALAFDSELKEYTAKVGENIANFTFSLTNISSKELIINSTQTSCGCTVAKLPSQPWKMAPGESGQIEVAVNLARKPEGTFLKGITFITSAGMPQIQVKVTIPPAPQMTEEERVRNATISKADAQAIFRGSCADCHVTPANGRMGGDIWLLMCGVCHESTRRAEMVPNLRALVKPTDFDFWKSAIANGRTNSLMPAFAISQGGPLSEEQVNSLADYLNKTMSRNLTIPAPQPAIVPIKTLAPDAVVVPPQPAVPAVQAPAAPQRPPAALKF